MSDRARVNGRFVSKKKIKRFKKSMDIFFRLKREKGDFKNVIHDHTYVVNHCNENDENVPVTRQAAPLISMSPTSDLIINNLNDLPMPSLQYDSNHEADSPGQSCDVPDSDENEVKDGQQQTNSWRQGRRIVELDVLADWLESGCSSCKTPLKLINIIKEERCGLASYLHVKCSSTCDVTKVPTGKMHQVATTYPKTWDVNTKLAAGILHAGIGHLKVNTLLASLNIPGLAHTTLKEREREVGKAIESCAQSSCNNACKLETSVQLNDNSKEVPSSSKDKENSVSFDAGWQKRGSSRSYNSLSGHASMIGCKSGKCVAYAVRNKSCRICQSAKKKGKLSRTHDCRKNWSGSSKAMESSMCVSMLKDLSNRDTKVNCIVMDDDTTSIAKARNEFDGSLEKKSDKNHVRKTLSNKLYDLQKYKKHKCLNTKTISHFCKCFSYAISQNKNNPDKLKTSLTAIVPHAFGDHSKCSKQWCGYLKSPKDYVPKNLPYKKNLVSESLKKDLEEIFCNFAHQSQKLSELGSSQANESFNHIVSSKNPKSNHYSGSESTCFRVATAVCQKNEGRNYMVEVNKELLLSPGEFTKEFANRCDKQHQAQKMRNGKKEHKLKRVKKKETTSKETTTKEVMEGTTYSSGIGLMEVEEDNLFEIPTATVPPNYNALPENDYSFIVFDLETTGLGLSEIVQISAITNSESFNCYILPTEPMTLGATEVTGIAVNNGKLFKHGIFIDSVNISTGLDKFYMWLKKFTNPVLVAHNGKHFDSQVICNAVMKIDRQHKLLSLIVGFIDTLPLFKDVLSNKQLKCFKQEFLAKELLGKKYNAHDALEDVKMLQELVGSLKIPTLKQLQHSFSIGCCKQAVLQKQFREKLLPSFHDMILEKVLTSSMAGKMAASGLGYHHILCIYNRNGEDGLKLVLGEKTNKCVRVTNSNKIIKRIAEYLKN